jgi:hypothetical protein
MINFIKRLTRLLRKEKTPKLSVAQIDELIDLNKDVLSRMGDEVDYDGMGNYGRFPPMEKIVRKRKLHEK